MNDLALNEQLVTATWSITVSDGEDDYFMHRLQGSPFVFTPATSSVPTATMQRIGGLQAGVMYCVKATVITSDTDQRVLWSHIYGEAER